MSQQTTETLATVPAVAEALAKLHGGVVEPYGHCEPTQCLYVRAPAGLYLDTGTPGGVSVQGNHLVLSVSRQPGNRLTISGVFPVDSTGHECRDWHGGNQDERVSIGVSADKPAERIAAEVQRRLLPAWAPILLRSLAILAQRQRYTAAQTEVIGAFRDAGFNVQVSRDGEASFNGPGNTRCRVYADSVRFEFFSCSPEKALRILQVLAEKE